MVTFRELEAIKLVLAGKSRDSIPYHVFEDGCEYEAALAALEAKGYLSDGEVTEACLADIESCRVRNAVIMAAGGSDISSKSVYSLPKGLYVKEGETLIERQIRQLKEVGIDDITVVVGYKQEMYFYLAEKHGVKLAVNVAPTKGNVLSLAAAGVELGSTYVCNCDNFFVENPFSAYEHGSFHATIFKQDASGELVVRTNRSGRILEVSACKGAGECVYGHAYMDPAFSYRFKRLLDEQLDVFRVDMLFWEEFLSRNVEDLDMYARRYDPGFLLEFDSVQEIQNIDGLFMDNVSDRVNEKICSILGCEASEIADIEILQKGLTNILFTFVVRGTKYIFRYPGDFSQAFIYRDREVRAQRIAADAGVDTTYVYIDETGCKMSEFRDGCKDLSDVYYKDVGFMCELARKIRAMHDGSAEMEDWRDFYNDPMEASDALMRLASQMKGDLFERFSTDRERMRRLYRYAEMDGVGKRMCHNDINADNVLVTEDSFDIIDWEFAGYNDPAYDFGRVIGGYDCDDADVDAIVGAYLGRECTADDRLHFLAYAAIHNYYYFNWALYVESIGNSSRDWMVFFYRQMRKFADYCLPLYEEKYGSLQEQG